MWAVDRKQEINLEWHYVCATALHQHHSITEYRMYCFKENKNPYLLLYSLVSHSELFIVTILDRVTEC